jgi:DNA-binding transcriptional ArsR family regulator
MMTESGAKHVYVVHAAFCEILTHPRRLEILDLLRSGEMSFRGLMAATGMKKANLSQHLTFLREKGVVGEKRTAEGLIFYLARPEVMRAYDIMHALMAGMMG